MVKLSKPNYGIFGPLKLDLELTKALQEEIERIERTYPVNIKIQILNTANERWNNWRNNKKKEYIEQRLSSVL